MQELRNVSANTTAAGILGTALTNGLPCAAKSVQSKRAVECATAHSNTNDAISLKSVDTKLDPSSKPHSGSNTNKKATTAANVTDVFNRQARPSWVSRSVGSVTPANSGNVTEAMANEKKEKTSLRRTVPVN